MWHAVYFYYIINGTNKNNMKNSYLKAVTGIFSVALVFTSCTTGNHNGHEWVDLGLSVKWATCNVGASIPSEYGDYYAWGEIETKTEYTEETSVTYGVDIDDISGNPQYDAATANWGEGWRMPTEKEYRELLEECDFEMTFFDGILGLKIIGPNGNSIFLPTAGHRSESSLYNVGEYGDYWSSTFHEDIQFFSFVEFRINLGGIRIEIPWTYRYYGLSVRPVTDK